MSGLAFRGDRMECICREHISRLKLHPFTSKYNISIQTNALFRCLATYMPDYLVKKNLHAKNIHLTFKVFVKH